ncbi:hypothetical protein RMAECT_0755 [Rickettsia rhipicephali str. Ect]|uniref:Uncharacterized protein n=1 Tax=Rickettsia rhipicephali str. Ect TaxID=1359199 RepID=A0A0F3PFU1_RICRH|nr:hypothetical protein RMAECT_0755 [Rickettsia rhipicephali str. Ect]
MIICFKVSYKFTSNFFGGKFSHGKIYYLMLCHSGEDHFSSLRGKLRSTCVAISCQSPEVATLLISRSQ